MPDRPRCVWTRRGPGHIYSSRPTTVYPAGNPRPPDRPSPDTDPAVRRPHLPAAARNGPGGNRHRRHRGVTLPPTQTPVASTARPATARSGLAGCAWVLDDLNSYRVNQHDSTPHRTRQEKGPPRPAQRLLPGPDQTVIPIRDCQGGKLTVRQLNWQVVGLLGHGGRRHGPL